MDVANMGEWADELAAEQERREQAAELIRATADAVLLDLDATLARLDVWQAGQLEMGAPGVPVVWEL